MANMTIVFTALHQSPLLAPSLALTKDLMGVGWEGGKRKGQGGGKGKEQPEIVKKHPGDHSGTVMKCGYYWTVTGCVNSLLAR